MRNSSPMRNRSSDVSDAAVPQVRRIVAAHAPAQMMTVVPSEMRMRQSTAEAMMKAPLQMTMVAQRMTPVMRMAKHAACIARQCSHGCTRRDVPPVRRLAGDANHRAAGNRRNHFEQMPRRRIPVQNTGHLANTLGQVRRSPGDGARNLGQ